MRCRATFRVGGGWLTLIRLLEAVSRYRRGINTLVINLNSR